MLFASLLTELSQFMYIDSLWIASTGFLSLCANAMLCKAKVGSSCAERRVLCYRPVLELELHSPDANLLLAELLV